MNSSTTVSCINDYTLLRGLINSIYFDLSCINAVHLPAFFQCVVSETSQKKRVSGSSNSPKFHQNHNFITGACQPPFSVFSLTFLLPNPFSKGLIFSTLSPFFSYGVQCPQDRRYGLSPRTFMYMYIYWSEKPRWIFK